MKTKSRQIRRNPTAKILSWILALALLFALAPPSLIAFAADGGYSDVSPDYWASGVIAKWSGDGYGVLQGDGNGHFFPQSGITLGELATILAKSFGYTERTAAAVTPAWADEYVEKAIAAGVIDKAATIDASVSVTREEAIKYIAIAYNVEPVAGETTFADNADIGAEYKPYINAFQKLGYVAGDNSDPAKSKFHPKDNYTRAEAMQVIDNTTAEIADTSITGQTYAKNLIVRASGVTVKDTTVKRDLIIGQGVGNGEVTLDNVTLDGQLLVFGGGSKSVTVKGGKPVLSTVASKPFGEAVHLSGAFDTITVTKGTKAIITGTVAKLILLGDNEVILTNATVKAVFANGDNIKFTVNSGSTVDDATVSANKVVISGGGAVKNVLVTDTAKSGVEVLTVPTKVTVDADAGAVKTKNGTVKPGETKTTANASSDSGGSGYVGGGVTPGNPDIVTPTVLALTVNTAFSTTTEDSVVNIAYTATPSTNSKIVEVTYSINNGAAEYLYYDANADGRAEKGTLGTGTVFLIPGENNIVFTAKDSTGATKTHTVSDTVMYNVQTIPVSAYEGTEVVESSEESGMRYISNRLIAYAKTGIPEAQVAEAVTAIGGTIVGSLSIVDLYYISVETSSETELRAKISVLEATEKFDNVSLDYIVDSEIEANTDPTDDPWWSNVTWWNPFSWFDNQEWGLTAIGLPDAWSEYDDLFRSVKVGIVDDGFRTTHEDLINLNTEVNNYDSGESEDNDHGTHIMGTIAAVRSNNKGLTGILDSSKTTVYGYDYLLPQTGSTSSTLTLGLIWNVLRGAKAINFSLGSRTASYPDERHEGVQDYIRNINKLLSKGYDFVIINSAGNGDVNHVPIETSTSRIHGIITNPEIAQRTIIVSAVDKELQLANFSNYGERVDVVAPGVDIWSTGADSDSDYKYKDGTSMAAPHVTGLAALVWSLNPGLTGTQVKDIIVNTANDYGEAVIDTRSNVAEVNRRTYHMINAKAACDLAVGATPTRRGYGSLAGHIVNAVNNENIAGAEIKLSRVPRDPNETANMLVIRVGTSDADGQYSITDILTGDYIVEISADGYEPEHARLQITEGVTTQIHTLNAIPSDLAQTNGTVTGSIINALTGALVTSEVTLDIRRGFDVGYAEVVQTLTTTTGTYSAELLSGNYTFSASAEGYITNNFYVTSVGGTTRANQNGIISPELAANDDGASTFRIVLAWGELPSDLDSHVVGPKGDGTDFHVYYSNRDYPNGGAYVEAENGDYTQVVEHQYTWVGIGQGTHTYGYYPEAGGEYEDSGETYVWYNYTPGSGDYNWDSNTNQYVEAVNGDYTSVETHYYNWVGRGSGTHAYGCYPETGGGYEDSGETYVWYDYTPGQGNYNYDLSSDTIIANLDVDDVSSYGPETITLNPAADGVYKYLIQDYSNHYSTDSNYLRNSQAVVRVYYGNATTESFTFNVPTGGGYSTVWHVFNIIVENGVGRVVPVNTMHNDATSPSDVGVAVPQALDAVIGEISGFGGAFSIESVTASTQEPPEFFYPENVNNKEWHK